MIRARARALVLVNWKGVFYERYLLDPNVTSLEGANGAGKTTVMIAAYVVLLPDMSRLRFTNLGETAGTGGDRGLFGRLGERGRPSYTALDIQVGPEERLVIGVHLERKAEPTVEPRAFLVRGLASDVRLSDLFLLKSGDQEVVPELGELAENAARLGGQMETFRSTKDYFAELFELGIFPLRLASEEERSKLNEMLKTSMTGGISRALTSELRGFLLREETGLSDALSRMRENLDTCRRTRTEVIEAQRLEREISGVSSTAQAMLRLAFAAARAEFSELSESARAKDRERHELCDTVAKLQARLEAASSRQRELSERLAISIGSRTRLQEELRRATQARQIREKLAALDLEHSRLIQELERARQVRSVASAQREDARAVRSAAQDSLARAAAGLARHQAGLDELERRAHAHRLLTEGLNLARDLLQNPKLDANSAVVELPPLSLRMEELAREAARRAREVETVSARRAEFERAFNELTRLAPDVTPQIAFERARRELRRAAELSALVEKLPELERELEELMRSSVRRHALVEKAERLGVTFSAGSAVPTLTRSWQEAEHELSELDARIHAEERALSEGRDRERALERRKTSLESIAAQRAEHRARISKLSGALGEALPDAQALHRARERLAQAREALRQKTALLSREREAALELAARLEAARGAVSQELLAIADEVDAELAVARFEDLEPESAGITEAALGVLSDALVVEDPLSAARAIAGRPREIAEVLFISPERVRLAADPSRIELMAGSDLLVRDEGLVRVTSNIEHPKLGRRARADRALALRARAGELEGEGETAAAALLERESLLREVERIVSRAEDFDAVDLATELAGCQSALLATRAEIATRETRLSDALNQRGPVRERALGLRALLCDSHLLLERAGDRSEPELQALLESARSGRAELERTIHSRRSLSTSVEALRVLPPSEEELARYEAERSSVEIERERLFRAAEALKSVVRHRGALAFADSEHALSLEVAIAPALQAEHELSLRVLGEAERSLEAAERELDVKTREFQQAEAEQLAISALRAREESELSSLGDLDASGARGASLEHLAILEREIERLTSEERASATESVLLQERLSGANSLLAELERVAANGRRAREPLEESWNRQRERAETLGASLDDLPDLEALSRSASELWAEARGKRELLFDRLGRARGGGEVARALRDRPPTFGGPPVEAELLDFMAVRDWLFRCLPGKVAEIADALTAIDGLRRDLVLLEERLGRQELDLRGTSEDVAQSIEVQIRRAQSQVRRLNQHLNGVRFGSIQAIRIRVGRIERMDQVLKALREGASQELLFQPTMPIEEALNEIFRRYAGGKNGGQRLLDYREYLEIGVEVSRSGDGDFEPANPTRLSTGEAIGVGAALMMMVLTEWERDANLLRGKRPVQSLRFLFLDEANRLSQDNLAVLFDLCQSLDLQLLIAAPEVAHAEGNTTYRLVRRKAADGREEVIVSGRKGILERDVSSEIAVNGTVD